MPTEFTNHLTSTQEITDRFQTQSNADYVYALVSGGGDSDTACQVAQDFDITLDGVVHVNTGTGIEETRRYVMERCLDWDLPYIELTSVDDADEKRQTDGIPLRERITDGNPFTNLNSSYHGVRRENDDYEKLVRKMGFPGPSMHWIMYLTLKHKPIKNFVKHHHKDDEDVAFVSGVRKQESDRRAKNMSEDGLTTNWDGCTVVSPIADWSDAQVSAYRVEHDLPSNPVSDILGMSGECLCGSYGDRDELEQMKRWGYNNAARLIENLEAEVYNGQVSKGHVAKEHSLWGHGNSQDLTEFGDGDDVQMLLCADCEADSCDPAVMSEKESTTQAEEMLKQDAHCEVWDRWFYCPDCNSILDDPITHRREVHAATPEPSYIDAISWDIREIENPTAPGDTTDPTELTGNLYTEPQMTKERRMRESVAQSLVPPEHTCEFTPTNQDGIQHCSDCGKFKIEADTHFETLLSDPATGKALEELIELEPGVLSTIILNDHINETNVIKTPEELQSVITADDIVEILTANVNSLTDYLAIEPSFEQLLTDAGLDVFIEEFNLLATDVLDQQYHTAIITALESEVETEDDDSQTLQPDYDPGQSDLQSFTEL